MNITPLFQAFPVDALPASMLKAVADVLYFTEAPPALVASSCIATASLATQNLVDIERREGLVGPTGLFVVTICASGERKTTVDNQFTRTIREFDRDNDLAHQAALRAYEGEYAVWRVRRRSAESELQCAIREDEPTDTLGERLAEIVKSAPQKPIHAPLLLNDATPAAIKEAFRKEGSGAGIFAGEASSVFSGNTLDEFALINELWDGGTVNIDRRSTGRWTIVNGRLSASLMVQPEVFKGFVERRGKSARDIGFFARMLIAYPPSTQGGRTGKHAPGQENVAQFNRRVKNLLDEAWQRRLQEGGTRQRLKFDWRAQQRWDEILDFVETSVGCLGHLAPFKDYAAKYADNLARLAATLHAFEGYSGDICLETLERAQTIACWYLENFKHLFSSPPSAVTWQPGQDAELLRNWLVNQYVTKGITVISKKRLAQYGPYRIRPVHRLNPALSLLESWQVICPRIATPNPVVQLHPLFVGHLQSQGTYPIAPVVTP